MLITYLDHLKRFTSQQGSTKKSKEFSWPKNHKKSIELNYIDQFQVKNTQQSANAPQSPPIPYATHLISQIEMAKTARNENLHTSHFVLC